MAEEGAKIQAGVGAKQFQHAYVRAADPPEAARRGFETDGAHGARGESVLDRIPIGEDTGGFRPASVWPLVHGGHVARNRNAAQKLSTGRGSVPRRHPPPPSEPAASTKTCPSSPAPACRPALWTRLAASPPRFTKGCCGVRGQNPATSFGETGWRRRKLWRNAERGATKAAAARLGGSAATALCSSKGPRSRTGGVGLRVKGAGLSGETADRTVGLPGMLRRQLGDWGGAASSMPAPPKAEAEVGPGGGVNHPFIHPPRWRSGHRSNSPSGHPLPSPKVTRSPMWEAVRRRSGQVMARARR